MYTAYWVCASSYAFRVYLTFALPMSTQMRLLVCAPSNGAVDEILTRLLRDGLLGPDGRGVTRNVVRIGAPPTDSADRPSDEKMAPLLAAAGWNAQVRQDLTQKGAT